MKHKVLLSILIISFFTLGFSFVGKAQAFSLNDLERLQSTVQSLKAEIASLKSQLGAQLRSIQLRDSTLLLQEPTRTATAPTTVSSPCGNKTLNQQNYRDTAYEDCVRQIQEALKVKVDGYAGSGTCRALFSQTRLSCGNVTMLQALNAAQAPATAAPEPIQFEVPTLTGKATLKLCKKSNEARFFSFKIFNNFTNQFIARNVLGSGDCYTNNIKSDKIRIEEKLPVGSNYEVIVDCEITAGPNAGQHLYGGPHEVSMQGNTAIEELDIGPGDFVTCTFTNTKKEKPTEEKHTHLINPRYISELVYEKDFNDISITDADGKKKLWKSFDKTLQCPSGYKALSGGYEILGGIALGPQHPPIIDTIANGIPFADFSKTKYRVRVDFAPGAIAADFDYPIDSDNPKIKNAAALVYAYCIQTELAIDQTAKPHYHP